MAVTYGRVPAISNKSAVDITHIMGNCTITSQYSSLSARSPSKRQREGIRIRPRFTHDTVGEPMVSLPEHRQRQEYLVSSSFS